MNHERLWTLGNKLRVLEGRGIRGWASTVKCSKEGTYCMEHWVLSANSESCSTPSRTEDVLYGD